LTGFPFLSGFYSKDLILELTYSTWTFNGTIAYWLGSFSAFFTSFYSFRIIYLVFFSKNNSYVFYLKHIHELPKSMGMPLLLLGFGSIFFGYFVKDFFIGFGSFYWQHSIYIKPQNHLHFDIEFIPLLIKNVPLFFTFSGFFLGWFWFFLFYKYKLFYSFINIFNFFNNKWYFDLLYNKYIGYYIYKISYFYTYILLDKGIFELFGSYGITQFFYSNIRLFKNMQSGYLYQYQCFFLISIFIFSFFYNV
jgi:NADH-ubiquinone oxidoreductase chain 5